METPDIEQIRKELTWNLRLRALYPEGNLQDMALPDDDEGTHFGAFLPRKLAGVVSLFTDGDSARVRKFAVDPDLQRQGIGGSLLEYVTSHARQHGVKTLWLSARVDAVGFYQHHGFHITGEPYVRDGIEHVRMEQTL